MANTRKVIKTKDVMLKGIVYIDGMATAKEAAELMRSNKVASLVVKKRNESDAYGIVVVHDLIKGVILADRDPEMVNVYEIMTKPLISIPGDMDVRYAARLLMRIGIRRAPVEENGEFIGMVSLNSLILDNMLF